MIFMNTLTGDIYEVIRTAAGELLFLGYTTVPKELDLSFVSNNLFFIGFL